jgi:dTMP kinase
MTAHPPVSGFFITLEGGEGAGKSTQIQLLAAMLRDAGHEVVVTREPGGSPGAEAIRGLILNGGFGFSSVTEALLFSAARLDHLEKTIRPALARGAIVLCDRFFDSTRAYQGASGGTAPSVLAALETIAVGATRPDLTLILDLPSELGLKRAHERRGAAVADRFEGEALSFHEKLRSGFLDIALEEPQRCVVVDAARPVEAVAAHIQSIVISCLGARAS